jgi:hypothetical protein
MSGPDLKWLQLPPYDIPGMAIISGLVVENRGKSAAQNVKIEVAYPATDRVIHHMEIVSDEPYIIRGGGERHSFVTLRLRTLQPGGVVYIYFAGHDQVTPQITVTSYQKSAWSRVLAGSEAGADADAQSAPNQAEADEGDLS